MTTPHCQMRVIDSAFYLSFYILRRDPHGRLRIYRLLNTTASCELDGDFVFSYHSMSRNTRQSHSVPGIDIIKRILELSYQWRRCFGSLKGFQSRLTIRANTNIFLCLNIRLNFIYTDQDGVYLSLENFPREILSLFPIDCLQTPSPVSFAVPDPSVNYTNPLTTRVLGPRSSQAALQGGSNPS